MPRDEMDSYESRGDGGEFRKSAFRPENKEDPRNVSQEAAPNNSTGMADQCVNSASISVTVGILELEQMLKQMTFTSSEIQRLTALLHSRACDNVVVERDVPTTPMASPQQPTTIENLPGDILSKILIRLLAKQVAQMRCVSKSWNAFLSQPSFIKSHLNHSINNNDQILSVFYCNFPNSKHKLYTAYACRPPHLKLTNFFKLPCLSPGHTPSMVKVIGSVHGLMCFSYGDDVIHIWNPSLSAVSTLSPYSFPCCSCYEIFFRFGYDPKTEDYKIVKITGFTGPLSEQTSEEEEEEDNDVPSFEYVFKKWLQVEIYSMRKGAWKAITQRFPSHIKRIFDNDKVCVDGHDGRLHWVGHTNAKLDSQVIVAFDLGSETFLEMPLPDSILNYNRSNTLGVLAGKLCVMSRDGDAEIEVWVMEEYGMAESWVKRRVFYFSHFYVYALTAFTSHNEFLYEDDAFRLVLYDPIADKARILDEYIGGKHGMDKIVEYVDSLVWIAPPMKRHAY